MASEPNQTQESQAAASPSATPTLAPASEGASLAENNQVAAPVRPEGLADDFWDAEKGVKVPDLIGKYKELETIKAERDARLAQVPAAADGYKLELPEGVTLPDNFELNPNDPRLPGLRELAKAGNWTQSEFGKVVAFDLAQREQQIAQLQEASAAEKTKLGANAPARIDATVQFINANSKDADQAKRVAAMLVTADSVEFFENVMKRMSSQGVDTLRQNGRDTEPTDPNKIEGYANMSFEQRRMAQLQRGPQRGAA